MFMKTKNQNQKSKIQYISKLALRNTQAHNHHQYSKINSRCSTKFSYSFIILPGIVALIESLFLCRAVRGRTEAETENFYRKLISPQRVF